ncbi:phospholipid scramblase 1 [Tulasnella sp. 330]|nr:phospholipid scramblase 1 [Tulasnella sp. 330]KAG8886479.1 phospholipid scramblase 1 [Tulasnella sp. 331]
MPSPSLKWVWAILNFALLAAGSVLIAISTVWRSHNPARNFVISELDLNAGLVLGIAMLITWAISIIGIIQRNNSTAVLIMTNWALIIDAIGVVVIGCIIWFCTLQETSNYLKVWEAATPATLQSIQDTLQCCGYRNSTELAVAAGTCANTATAANLPGSTVCVVNRRKQAERFIKIDAKRGGRGFV